MSNSVFVKSVKYQNLKMSECSIPENFRIVVVVVVVTFIAGLNTLYKYIR